MHHQFDYVVAGAAMESVGTASTLSELNDSLSRFCSAAGLDLFLLVHTQGPSRTVANVVHNLANDEAATFAVQHPTTVSIVGSSMPVLLTGSLRASGLIHGVAAGAPHGDSVACAALLGGPRPLAQDEVANLLGYAVMLASHAIAACLRITKDACPFTDRELDCLRLVAAGASYRDAARVLGVSHRTVEEHLVRCRTRLGFPTAIAAMTAAVRGGWISPAEVELLANDLNSPSRAGQR